MSKLTPAVEKIVSKYGINPPFIHKGFHARFYAIDFVPLLWNRWGKYEGYYFKSIISTFHDRYWTLYYIPSELTALRNHYLTKVETDKTYLSKHYADWKRLCKNLDKSTQVLEKSIKFNEPFPLFFKKYQIFIEDYLSQYALAVAVQEACSFQPELWIHPEIEKFCDKYKLELKGTTVLLTSPVAHSFVTKEELDLLTITLEYKKSKNQTKLQEAIKKHQQKWFWVQNNYASIKEISLEEFEQRVHVIASLSVVEIKQKIKQLEQSPKVIKEEKKTFFTKHTPTSKLKLYIKVNELFFEMQDIRKGYVLLANHYHKIFLERVSKDYEIHIEDLWLYSPEEIVHLCTTKKIISPKELEQRKVMMVEVQSKSERIIFSGKQAQEFYQHLQEETLETTEFKGTIASMGKTQGRVVIVLKTHDLLRVERGDILVSSMTRPEMTVAMHKAAAFVTDEGGITSHAAIVARELHKPCVIGTKIATKILKDGDLVEVDANKGIIKILRKNS